MRTKLIVGNWKMNASLADAHVLADGVRNQAEHLEHVEIVLCPPAIWLSELAHSISPGKFSHLHLGAQNMHPEEHGTFTGEISVTMVRSVADYVILGHSERTHLFDEGPAFVEAKLRSALDHGLTPILCVGEDEKSATTGSRVLEMLRYYVHGLTEEEMAKVVVAYEPVWAISHGAATPAEPDYVAEVIGALRQAVGADTRIIYGGSVNDQNVGGFLEKPEIDGYLVGNASLNLKSFLTICRMANDLSIPSKAA